LRTEIEGPSLTGSDGHLISIKVVFFNEVAPSLEPELPLRLPAAGHIECGDSYTYLKTTHS
jgi:hypothetical protein